MKWYHVVYFSFLVIGSVVLKNPEVGGTNRSPASVAQEAMISMAMSGGH